MKVDEIKIQRSVADKSRFNLEIEYDNGHYSSQRLLTLSKLRKELGEFLEISIRQ